MSRRFIQVSAAQLAALNERSLAQLKVLVIYRGGADQGCDEGRYKFEPKQGVAKLKQQAEWLGRQQNSSKRRSRSARSRASRTCGS